MELFLFFSFIRLLIFIWFFPSLGQRRRKKYYTFSFSFCYLFHFSVQFQSAYFIFAFQMKFSWSIRIFVCLFVLCIWPFAVCDDWLHKTVALFIQISAVNTNTNTKCECGRIATEYVSIWAWWGAVNAKRIEGDSVVWWVNDKIQRQLIEFFQLDGYAK